MFLNITPEQWVYLFRGAGFTVLLSLIGIAGGCVVAAPIALARVSKRAWLRNLSGGLVFVVQGIPLPVTMFVVYFGISIINFKVPVLIAAGAAMTVNASVYFGEIWKGAIQSVPRTQWEAGDSLALTYFQRMRYVILPQALLIATPPSVGFMVALIKNTSYAVVIGAAELTYSSRIVNNSTFQPFVIFTIAAVIYFAICFPLSVASEKLERRIKRA